MATVQVEAMAIYPSPSLYFSVAHTNYRFSHVTGVGREVEDFCPLPVDIDSAKAQVAALE
jgi:hypothetical protein